tara:strand:- start:1083 stop:2774 length:1692 start_codon:yes stop_codon:yes gene_type:complete
LAQKQIFLAPEPDRLLFADSLNEVAKRTKDANIQAEAFYLYGKINESMGDIVTSMSWFLKSLKILESKGDSPKLVRLYARIAMVEYNKGNLDQVLAYTTKGIAVAKRINSQKYLVTHYDMLARLFVEPNDILKNVIRFNRDSAMYYLNKVEQIAIQLNDSILIANNSERKASLLFSQFHDKTAALSKLNYALGIYMRYNKIGDKIRVSTNLAEYYIHFNQPSKAFIYITMADSIYRNNDINAFQFTSRIYEVYSQYYQKTEKWKQAFKNAEKYHQFHINQYVADRDLALSRQSFAYEAEKKDALLKASGEELMLKSEALSFQRKFMIAISLLLIVAIVGCVLLYKLFIKNAKLKELNAGLVREQSHRVTNHLQSFSSYLSLNAHDGSMNSDHFMDELQIRIQSMGVLHRLLYSGKALSHVSAEDFFEDIVSTVLKVYGMDDLLLVCEIEDLDIPLDIAGPLGLILTELTSNTCKHAAVVPQKTIIKIQFHKTTENKREHGYLVFADNGIGYFGKSNSKKGFGSKLIEMEAEHLNAHYTYRNDHGLVFEMLLPLNNMMGHFSPN